MSKNEDVTIEIGEEDGGRARAPTPTQTPKSSGCRRCLESVGGWFAYKDKGKWLEDMKGSLSLAASIIATMTFQHATNPPGGIVQASFDDKALFNCSKSPCPGESVMAIRYPHPYDHFLLFNTICFISSLSVCLLLVSGIPLNHRFPTWLLSIGMSVTITTLALTYTAALSMVTPYSIWVTFRQLYIVGLIIWHSLLGIIAFLLITRLFVWSIKQFQSTKT